MPLVSLRKTGTLIITFPKTVVKFPFATSCWREMRLEKHLLVEVAADTHFGNHLPRCQYVAFAQRCERLIPFRKMEDLALLEAYAKKAFRDSARWPTQKLGALVRQASLRRMASRWFPEQLPYLESAMSTVTLPQSSAHGDFHADNILLKQGGLVFIDWSHYSPTASRYFDLIDFHVHALKSQDESWTAAWLRSPHPASLYGVSVPPGCYDAYAIWKLSEDFWVLELRGLFDEHKAKKYNDFMHALHTAWPL